MIYSVKLDQSVNFAPETVEEEVLQNVRTILLTRVGAVCLHRDFGVSWEHLDKPYPVARALMQEWSRKPFKPMSLGLKLSPSRLPMALKT